MQRQAQKPTTSWGAIGIYLEAAGGESVLFNYVTSGRLTTCQTRHYSQDCQHKLNSIAREKRKEEISNVGGKGREGAECGHGKSWGRGEKKMFNIHCIKFSKINLNIVKGAWVLGNLPARCSPPMLHSSYNHPRPPASCVALSHSPAATIQSKCWYSHGSHGTGEEFDPQWAIYFKKPDIDTKGCTPWLAMIWFLSPKALMTLAGVQTSKGFC